ncbi:MAG: DUF3105 domain-containing protein [Chloroflexota bacterium]
MAKKHQSSTRIRRRQIIEAEQQKGFPTWGWYAIGGVVAILIVAGLFFLDSRSIRNGVNPARDIEGAQVLPEPGRGHLNGDITYAVPIPVGGQHNPAWQNCGIYEDEIRTENAIHSMEHGAVWISYQPEIGEAQVEQLRELVRGERTRFRNFYLLAPKSNAPAPIVVTAWRAQLEVEDAGDDRILDFMQRFHVGPFTPERGAACTGGVGEPSS